MVCDAPLYEEADHQLSIITVAWHNIKPFPVSISDDKHTVEIKKLSENSSVSFHVLPADGADQVRVRNIIAQLE